MALTVACFDGVIEHPPRVGPAFRRAERASTTPARRRRSASSSSGSRPSSCRERRPDPPRPRAEHEAAADYLREPRAAAARRPRQPRHPTLLAGAFDPSLARSSALHWQTTTPVYSSPDLAGVGLNSVRPSGYQRGRIRRCRPRAGRAAARRAATRRRSAWSCSTTSCRCAVALHEAAADRAEPGARTARRRRAPS